MSSRPSLGSVAPQLGRWRFVCALYLACMGAVIVVASQGALPLRVLSPWDGVCHFVLLGIAGWLVHRALGRRKLRGGLPLGPLIVALAATLEELSQLGLAARHFELSDLAANLAGITVVYGLDELWQRWRRGQPHSSAR